MDVQPKFCRVVLSYSLFYDTADDSASMSHSFLTMRIFSKSTVIVVVIISQRDFAKFEEKFNY